LQLTIVEMKLGFNLELLPQVVPHMWAADEVWLAVAASCRGRDRDRRVHRLCRLIGFGPMAIDATHNRIEVLAEPGPYRPHSRRGNPSCALCPRHVVQLWNIFEGG